MKIRSEDLSASQMRVLVLMADGMTFKEIADTLDYSPKTLYRILSRLFRHMNWKE